MSTRRARIKAVAALPPRRKNLDNADGKSKQNASKDTVEKSLKSPKTPISHIVKNDEKTSPAVKNNTRTPPALLPINSVLKTIPDKVPSPTIVVPPVEIDNNVNTPRSERVPVITSVSGIKNVFASPPPRNSPDRRRIASPSIPPSPKPITNSDGTQKLATQTSIAQDNSNKSPTSSTTQNNEKVSATTSTEKKNYISDDYSVPSVPESLTDEAVMDGIVPLQTSRSAPKPIDLLKNEIIAESAEVLFDPIVPLPSPSKVRPKLRPVPRLAPHRRNSIQGSASESEDESRRALLNSGAATPAPPRQRHDSHTSHSTLHSVPNREMSRVRNDSVCSSVSQIATQPPPATSPVKEKHFSKTRRQEMSRRTWWRRKDVKRDALTMYDLIFYNPTTNPIIPDQDEISAKEANAKEEAERNAKTQESEEDADDPPATDAAPVPQIKLGPNGEIILDENSLVIKQSDANRKVSSVVREGSWAGSGGGRYTRSTRTADWSAAETVRFYRALGAIGTDFSLMAPLFPDRTRRDLYLKFKKEERLNGGQVDKALRSATAWDVTRLQEEFTKEREEAAKRAEAARQRLLENKKAERERLKAVREMRIRPSRGAKALESTSFRSANRSCIELTADAIVQRTLKTRAAKKAEEDKLKKAKVTGKRASGPQIPPPPPAYATLTLIGGSTTPQHNKSSTGEMATISRIDSPQIAQAKQVCLNQVAGVPTNIENGSLVVLRVNDPASPSKTILQTYIAQGAEKLIPIALPPMFLNSVVGYMKKGTAKSTRSTASSPQLTSPSSVASFDSRSTTPSVIQLNPSPAKRQRHSSYSITPL